MAGPLRQPPDPQPQAGPSVPRRVPKHLPAAPTPSAGPAASKPPPDGKKETAPAAALSSKACTGAAAKPKQPSWLRLSPAGGPTPREGQCSSCACCRACRALPPTPCYPSGLGGTSRCAHPAAAAGGLGAHHTRAAARPGAQEEAGPGRAGAGGPADVTGTAAAFCAEGDRHGDSQSVRLPITHRSSAVPRSTHAQRRSEGRDVHPPAPAPALSQIPLSCLSH